MISLILIFIGTYLLGWIILEILSISSPIEKVASSFLLGTLLSTYILFILFSFTKLDFNLGLEVIFFSSITVLWVLLARFSQKQIGKPIVELLTLFRRRNYNYFEVAIIGILLFLVLNLFLSNYYWPIVDWDSLALYDFRAKVLVEKGSFDSGLELGYFFHYTPFTSILHALNYVAGVSHAKVWYSALFVAYLLIFYYFLRQRTSRWVAILGVGILASTSMMLNHAKMAYTNLPYTIYLTTGLFYLLSWWESGNKKLLLLGAIFVAGSTWIRLTEPFWIVALIVIVAGIVARYRSQWLYGFIACITIIAFKYPWALYISNLFNTTTPPLVNLMAVETTSHQQISILAIFHRVGEVSIFLLRVFNNLVITYALPIVLSLLSIIFNKNWKNIHYFLLLFLMLTSIFFGTVYFSFQFPDWQSIPDSALRMSMFLLPQIIFVIMLSDFWKIKIK